MILKNNWEFKTAEISEHGMNSLPCLLSPIWLFTNISHHNIMLGLRPYIVLWCRKWINYLIHKTKQGVNTSICNNIKGTRVFKYNIHIANLQVDILSSISVISVFINYSLGSWYGITLHNNNTCIISNITCIIYNLIDLICKHKQIQ